MRTIRALLKNESGATAIEYALLIAGVGVFILTALTGVQGALTGLFGRVVTMLS